MEFKNANEIKKAVRKSLGSSPRATVVRVAEGDTSLAIHVIYHETIIVRLDVSTVKVNLATDSTHYISAKDLVIGQFATRTLNPGDLISISDFTRTSRASEV